MDIRVLKVSLQSGAVDLTSDKFFADPQLELGASFIFLNGNEDTVYVIRLDSNANTVTAMTSNSDFQDRKVILNSTVCLGAPFFTGFSQAVIDWPSHSVYFTGACDKNVVVCKGSLSEDQTPIACTQASDAVRFVNGLSVFA